MVRALIAVSCVTAAVLSAGEVAARPAKVALVAVEIGGDGAPELRPQLASSIAAGFRKAKVKTVKLEVVQRALASSPELVGCLSSTCLARLGEITGADAFVRVKVSADGADYNLVLELYSTEELVNKLELPCSVCTISELNQALVVTTAKLLEDAPEQPVHVIIRSEPSGAKLTIDGVARGLAPYEGPLARGPHQIVAEVANVGRVERRVVVNDRSSTEPILIQIGTPADGRDETQPIITSDSRLGTVKWVTGSAAVGALVTGAVLITLDGRGTCGASGQECERELNTGLAGWITLGGGVALSVAAGWMFWADDRDERGNRLTVAPSPDGGGMAVLSGQF